MRPLVRLLGSLLVLSLAVLVPPTSAGVATPGPTLYVDGKSGFDSPTTVGWTTEWGLSPARPFKTVERALEETNHGSPAAIRIRGYDDYVYRESITRGYRIGTSTTPVEISSYTTAELPSGPLIRPIIDGGIEVGTSGWTRPSPTKYPHVWCKTWNPPSGNLVTGQKVPPGYDTPYDATHEDRLYMDGSQPLQRPASVPTMAQLNAQPYSQYWDRSKTSANLCVHLGLWSGNAVDENPATHTITVPWYFGIILAGGSSHVMVRDLRIRHTIMGVGLSVSVDKAVGKAHDNTIFNVDASYNYRMGFWTAGDNNVFDHVSGSRNSIQLLKLDVGAYSDGTPYGAQHNTIRDSISDQNLGHGMKLSGRLVQWNYVYSNTIDGTGIPAAAKSAGGATQAIQIANGASNNAIWRNLVTGTDAGVELYQYDGSGGPLTGNAVHDNRFEHVGTGVFLWDNKVSQSFGTGATTFDHNVYYDTQTAIGGNGTSSGKVFDHETITHSGFQSNASTPSIERAGVALMAGSITIRNTIIDDTNGPSICPRANTTVYLSYSDTYRWLSDPRSSMPHGAFCKSTSQHAFGLVKVGPGTLQVDPAYVTDPASPDFLVIGAGNALRDAASDGGAIGALWTSATIVLPPSYVVRYAGASRFGTAAAVSAHTFDPGVPVAYIANAFNFPDALAGAAAAGTIQGPVLLAAATGPLDPATAAELSRLKPVKIIVLGGSGVVSDAVLNALKAYATAGNVVRYAGASRFGTAAAVSAHTFDPGVPVAYIANAFNFPDALAGAAAAGTIQGPVLLAAATGPLDPATAAELSRLKPVKIIVLGGSGVVSDAVLNALKAYATAGNVVRYAGASRFGTAAAVSAHTFDPGVPVAYIANAFNFPDALAGAAAAGTIQGPVLLAAATGPLDPATAAELSRLKPVKIIVLGGSGVVSDAVLNALKAYAIGS